MKGDAIELVHAAESGMDVPRGRGLCDRPACPLGGLLETLEILETPGRRSGPAPEPPAGPSGKAAGSPPDGPTGLPVADALALVDEAAERLWTPEGAAALAYLQGRGLTEATIRAARLGWTPRAMLPTADGIRFWRASGIVIPWHDAGRLALVKIRQPAGREPKYAEAFADRPRIYPGPEAIRPGTPLVIVEGEFDAVLLGQELGNLAAVVTLGSASSTRPEAAILGLMLPAPVWYLATDADAAGDRAASGWPARARSSPAPGREGLDRRSLDRHRSTAVVG